MIKRLISLLFDSKRELLQSANPLTLFPDTNFLYHSNDLRSLDWRKLGSPSIEVIIVRPIQRELDRHKGQGNARIARKARRYGKLLKGLVEAEDQSIRMSTDPIVFIRLDSSNGFRRHHKRFDLLETDEQYVAAAYDFKRRFPQKDVRLLTYDIGPQLTAKNVGLTTLIPPDDWKLLPSVSDNDAKPLVPKAEHTYAPSFDTALADDAGAPIDRLGGEFAVFSPIEDGFINSTIEAVRLKFVRTVSSEPSAPPDAEAGRYGLRTAGLEYVWVAPTADQVERYESAYDSWEERLKVYLSNLHRRMQVRQKICGSFKVINSGTTPAIDALVTISVTPNLRIRPTVNEDEEVTLASIPKPPLLPKGEWKLRYASSKQFYKSLARSRGISSFGPFDLPSLHLPDPLRNFQSKRDPNAFYFKGGKPDRPRERYALECAQWRHKSDPVSFPFEITPAEIPTGHRLGGRVEIQVEASNLPEPLRYSFAIAARILPLETVVSADAELRAMSRE